MSKIPPHYLRQFFKCDHLPENLQKIVRPFADLAEHLDNDLKDNPEKTTAIRKLLEAKDCAVRSVIYKEPAP